MKEEKKFDKFAVGLAIVVLGTCYYLFSRKDKSKSELTDEEKLRKGIELFEKENYYESFLALDLIIEKDLHILDKMVIAYENIQDKDQDITVSVLRIIEEIINNYCNSSSDLIIYISKDIKAYEHLLSYERNSEEKYLLQRNVFKDLFVLTILDNKEEKSSHMAKDLLSSMVMYKSSHYKITGDVSKIIYMDFLGCFSILFANSEENSFFYTEKQKKLFYSGDFCSLLELLENDDSESTEQPNLLIFKGMLLFSQGNTCRASSCFQKSNDPIAKLFLTLLGNVHRSDKVSSLLKSIKKNKEKYLTGLVVASMISEKETDFSQALYYLDLARPLAIENSSHVLDFIDNFILVNKIRLCKNQGLVEQIEERLMGINWNDTRWFKHEPLINFICIAIEYSLSIKNYLLCEKIYSAFLGNSDDTRLYLFENIISAELENTVLSVEKHPAMTALISAFKTACEEDKNIFLEKAIEKDPKYFKNYFYYGNFLMGTPQSIKMYNKALLHASKQAEIVSIFHVLIATEIQLDVHNSKINRIITSDY